MIRRIYTDTSAIGGCLDTDFEEPSTELLDLDRFKFGQDVIVLPEANKEYVELTEESAELAKHYIDARVIGESKRVDAQHIAVATVNRVDVIVSWNFRHIVNLRRIRGYNSVNLRFGYSMIEITQEVIEYEEEDL